MSANLVVQPGVSFEPEPSEPVMESLFQQYERVLVQNLLSSFALDFLLYDQHGGDVDTIHTVRQIGQDDQMTYKNKKNQVVYEQMGAYDSREYHQDPRYIEKNREVSAQKKAGTLVDAYTGERIPMNGKTDLDHVISAKEIHEDRGRVLAGIAGTDLANSDVNLQATNPHTNRSKKADSMDDFLERKGDEYTEEQKALMRKRDATARKAYKDRLARTYYTSPQFAKDLGAAATKVGASMGARQALGFVFAEMWFAVKEEFQAIEDKPFDLGDFLKSIGNGLKKGLERAKVKYKELFAKFLDGAIAGALASLTTTLCNIFFTTAKNVVRIVRQSYASLVEAAKVLFINPENYTFGERMRAVAKILATGASVVAGVVVSDVVASTGISTIPVIGDIVPSFCGAFVSGILSCTLLYFLDRSKTMNKLIKALDGLHTIETEVNYYRQQAEYFERYAAELDKIDLEQFKKEIAFYGNITTKLESAGSEEELNRILKEGTSGIQVMFQCNQCGECCRHVGLSPLYQYLDRGDGVCKYLVGNLCSIYESRPLVCRVDESYDAFFQSRMSKEEYYRLNYEACDKLKRKMI